jgi:hypothetical protein
MKSKAQRASTSTSVDRNALDCLVLSRPCALQDHFTRLLHSESGTVYGIIRTTSWDWDGCGGRTDLHDVFSALWAIILRVHGMASSRLIDVEGFGGQPELYERVVLFDQPDYLRGKPSSEQIDFLKAYSAHAAHLMGWICGLEHEAVKKRQWDDRRAPNWVKHVRKLIKRRDPELWVTRSNPDWRYYTASGNALSVVEFLRPFILRDLLHYYRPLASTRGARHVIRTDSIFNAVSEAVVRKALQVIGCVEGQDAPPWRGFAPDAENNAIVAVPLESHCAFIGRRSLVIMRTESGYKEYARERKKWIQRSRTEVLIFNVGVEYEWTTKVDFARFQELAYALLEVEPGVERIREAGGTNESDQGRDLVADWLVAEQQGRIVHPVEGDNSVVKEATPFIARRILIQVKTRAKSVGKSDVRDVRDTIEWNSASGYLLIAYPVITEPLVRYLESLRGRGFWIDWWSKQEIESRLRGHPEIVSRFPDLLTLKT